MRKDNENKLLALTNKFLDEFLDIASEGEDKRNDLFHFNFTLARCIAKSNYPRYDEVHTCLLGMSGFDTNISKEFFNNNIQGFTKTILDVVESGRNDDDYRIDDLESVNGTKEVNDYDWDYVDDKMSNFKINKKTVGTETISFNLSNSRNSFKGRVKIFKIEKDVVLVEGGVEVVKNNVMTLENISFYNFNNELVMSIDLDYEGREKGEIVHYKYIADINSFFLLLNNI